GAGADVTAQPAARVGHLVVVLQIGQKRCRPEIKGRSTTPPLLPRIALPLVKIAPLKGGNQLLRRPPVIAVVGCTEPGQRHHRTVVEVIVPECVEAVPTALWCAD